MKRNILLLLIVSIPLAAYHLLQATHVLPTLRNLWRIESKREGIPNRTYSLLSSYGYLPSAIAKPGPSELLKSPRIQALRGYSHAWRPSTWRKPLQAPLGQNTPQ